ncbi:hypothetical protein C2S51_012917 [Perilla frutescens var. frutescens]|nr:hypothetical protein C2S51_012917 [Perilla frutescens var. frutescens]
MASKYFQNDFDFCSKITSTLSYITNVAGETLFPFPSKRSSHGDAQASDKAQVPGARTSHNRTQHSTPQTKAKGRLVEAATEAAHTTTSGSTTSQASSHGNTPGHTQANRTEKGENHAHSLLQGKSKEARIFMNERAIDLFVLDVYSEWESPFEGQGQQMCGLSQVGRQGSRSGPW